MQTGNLHQFRVGVKKLRAFFTLADSAEKEPDLVGRLNLLGSF